MNDFSKASRNEDGAGFKCQNGCLALGLENGYSIRDPPVSGGVSRSELCTTGFKLPLV